ncbi:hypothetical protein RF11_04975 [Thelohanellus kitauei]|uniref:Uncharacterized protein n=1 Tax=Thelohanellus kitauei TaxID=669202 RepID=A0A0C2JA94_THEKT|nr:hypothetical protein RF11_04975 [Thelohanellus kitauei]
MANEEMNSFPLGTFTIGNFATLVDGLGALFLRSQIIYFESCRVLLISLRQLDFVEIVSFLVVARLNMIYDLIAPPATRPFESSAIALLTFPSYYRPCCRQHFDDADQILYNEMLRGSD